MVYGIVTSDIRLSSGSVLLRGEVVSVSKDFIVDMFGKTIECGTSDIRRSVDNRLINCVTTQQYEDIRCFNYAIRDLYSCAWNSGQSFAMLALKGYCVELTEKYKAELNKVIDIYISNSTNISYENIKD